MISNYMKVIAVLVGVFLITTSCNDWLDITPESDFSREEIFSTEDGFVDALYANYRGMSEATMYGIETLWGFNDVRAQYYEVQDNMYYYPISVYELESSRNIASANIIWKNFYKRIASLNSLLVGLDNSSEQKLKYYNYYKGEALALRALLHFDLVRLFGPNYVDEPDKICMPYVKAFQFETPKHITVKEVYENVLADLKAAEALLIDDPILVGANPDAGDLLPVLTDRKSKMNLLAVKGLLARVHYFMRDLETANQYAQEVIDNEGGQVRVVNPELVAIKEDYYVQDPDTKEIIDTIQVATAIRNPDRLFQSEIIFGLQYPEETNWLNASFHFNETPGSYGALHPDRAIGTWYNLSDIRFAAYFTWMDHRNMFYFHRYEKDNGVYPYTSAVLRLPEMYFIAMEYQMDQDLAGAREMYNDFRETRWAEPVDESELANTDQFFFHLTLERRREFFGDGQLFYFYKLHDLDIIVNEHSQVSVPNGAWVLPLPEDEIKYGDI